MRIKKLDMLLRILAGFQGAHARTRSTTECQANSTGQNHPDILQLQQSETTTRISDWPGATESHAIWAGDRLDGTADCAASPKNSLGQDQILGEDLITTTSNPEAMCILGNSQCGIPLSHISGAAQQDNMRLDEPLQYPSDLGLQASGDFSLIANTQDLCFWDDVEYIPPLYQGSYADFEFDMFPVQNQAMSTDPQENDFDSTQEASEAPPPTFLGSRASPDPQEGQNLQFRGLLHKAFSNRRHLAGTTSGGRREPNGLDLGLGSSSARSEQAYRLSLVGAFPALLSEGDDAMWEPENLAHVRPLTQAKYDTIVAKFKTLNGNNGHHTQFVTGNFPSLAACDAFIQLYFEEFNHIFPFIHQPSFDPASVPWLLTLAVIATGCRFSRITEAVQCADVLQEFLRRAFYAVIEDDYSSTCEPWLAQSGLLNQIAMQFSRDMQLVESAQAMRSTLDMICRKINCFRDLDRHTNVVQRQQSPQEAWKAWIRKESLLRLAYTLWLVDSQYVLFLDQPPVTPTNLLRVRLPSSENLWHAPTAGVWSEYLEHNGMCSPGNLRQELNNLYKTQTRRNDFGDFAILLLVLGVFRNALELCRALKEGLAMHVWALQDSQGQGLAPESISKISSIKQEAMAYITILCPENKSTPTRATTLKSAIMHHQHTIGIALGIPLGELFCYMGYRVTSTDVSHCRNRLRAWVKDHGTGARQVALHAGQLFASIRQSSMHGYWEPRAIFIACLSLWVFGENIDPPVDLQDVTVCPTIRLDQQLDKKVVDSWVQDGAGMRPCLAGVGSITGAEGVVRLIREGSKVLQATSIWPISQVQSLSLHIFHKLRSSGS